MDVDRECILTPVGRLYLDLTDHVEWKTLETIFIEEGIDIKNDPRIGRVLQKLMECDENIDQIKLTLPEFIRLLYDDAFFFKNALLRSLTINRFEEFACVVEEIFECNKYRDNGEINKRSEIYRVTGQEWSVSIMSVDGQKIRFGEKSVFTLNELCGPLIYGLAIDLVGESKVRALKYDAPRNDPNAKNKVGEISKCIKVSDISTAGWFLSDTALILISTLIKLRKIDSLSEGEKHDYIFSFFKAICCNELLQFSNAYYSESKQSEHKLISMAHLLKACSKSRNQIPFIDAGLDLLFQLRSMEITTDTLASIGAVLANGGLSLYNKKRILSQNAVSQLLEVMYSGGLKSLSPMFAVQAGVPGICTDSGAMLVVIPGVLAMGLYSPKMKSCCSVRSYHFAIELIKKRGYHPYCKLNEKVISSQTGQNLTKHAQCEVSPFWEIFNAAADGDIHTIENAIINGVNISKLRDTTELSLLHVAAANGHLKLVKFLLLKQPDLLRATDVFDKRALCYAEDTGNDSVVQYLAEVERAPKEISCPKHYPKS